MAAIESLRPGCAKILGFISAETFRPFEKRGMTCFPTMTPSELEGCRAFAPVNKNIFFVKLVSAVHGSGMELH
jgi:hypothetical protein